VKSLARNRDHAEIQERLGRLRDDSARRWGRMTAHQMVCHLSDGYRLLTGERTARLAPTPLPRPLMKCVALYVPVRWPRSVPTTPELDQDASGTRPAAFDADVAELRGLIDRIAVERRGHLADVPHPIFGPMSEASWLRWAYLHADHHLRQFGL
jgi:hypothetical protein